MTLIHDTCSFYPDLQRLVNLMPQFPISIRKGIMTICRVQQSPYENIRLRKALQPVLQYQFSSSSRREPYRNYHFELDVLPIILAYIHQPLFLGFISMCLRCIPLEDQSEAIDILEQGIDKEISAITGPDRHQILDYSCIFGDEENISRPLNVMLPPRPALSLSIRYRLRAWKVVFVSRC